MSPTQAWNRLPISRTIFQTMFDGKRRYNRVLEWLHIVNSLELVLTLFVFQFLSLAKYTQKHLLVVLSFTEKLVVTKFCNHKCMVCSLCYCSIIYKNTKWILFVDTLGFAFAWCYYSGSGWEFTKLLTQILNIFFNFGP